MIICVRHERGRELDVALPTPTPGLGQLYVPDIIGHNGAAADYALRGAGLMPKHVGQASNWLFCSVVTQNPPAGTIVNLNSTVSFTTALDNEPGCPA